MASTFESLGVLAGGTCYDHAAGTLAVPLPYKLTPMGTRGVEALGIDIDTTRPVRPPFANACLDWSEYPVGGCHLA